MKKITATAFKKDCYRILDKVIQTGMPLEVIRNGKRLRVELVDNFDKFKKLKPRDAIVGDLDELVNLKVYEWNEEKNL